MARQRGASSFPPIPPDHPLAVAARDSNAYAEEYGLEKTIEWAEMGISTGELAYLAEQRAYRALAVAVTGHNVTGTALDERVIQLIRQTPLWQDFGPTLMSAYMDGFVIGWKGHELSLKSDD